MSLKHEKRNLVEEWPRVIIITGHLEGCCGTRLPTDPRFPDYVHVRTDDGPIVYVKPENLDEWQDAWALD